MTGGPSGFHACLPKPVVTLVVAAGFSVFTNSTPDMENPRMKITVLKSTAETALALIQKTVSCVRLPLDFHPVLTFRAGKQDLWLECTLHDRHISLLLPDAECDEKGGTLHLGLELFRQALLQATGHQIELASDTLGILLCSDGRQVAALPAASPADTAPFQPPAEADSTYLPNSFANFLLQAFSCASDDNKYTAVTGVNVSKDGIAGTDGKQLFHLPLPLQLKDAVTLPPSKCHAALKVLRWTSLCHWRNAAHGWMYAIQGEGFRYAAKAVDAPYPDYRRLLAAEADGDVSFMLTPEGAGALEEFLAARQAGLFVRLTVHKDRVVLEDMEGVERGKAEFAASAEGSAIPCSVPLNTRYLRQFLKMGFRSMSMSSRRPAPLVSVNGVGKYLFMPCGEPAPSTQTASSPVVSPVVPPVPQVNPKPAAATGSQPKKEKNTMPQSTSPTPFIPANAANVSQAIVAANPLDETLASLASMREQLSNLESRLLEAGRKIKAALLEQRQKERQYAEAARKLERIRMAV